MRRIRFRIDCACGQRVLIERTAYADTDFVAHIKRNTLCPGENAITRAWLRAYQRDETDRTPCPIYVPAEKMWGSLSFLKRLTKNYTESPRENVIVLITKAGERKNIVCITDASRNVMTAYYIPSKSIGRIKQGDLVLIKHFHLTKIKRNESKMEQFCMLISCYQIL